MHELRLYEMSGAFPYIYYFARFWLGDQTVIGDNVVDRDEIVRADIGERLSVFYAYQKLD